jgi:hypothetical protein
MLMSIRQLVVRGTAASAVALPLLALPLLMGGCVSNSGDVQSARLSNNFQVYAPFDNERDTGPSYLVGAPSHHAGDEPQVDDSRATPRSAGATAADPASAPDPASPADPKGPPMTASPPVNNGTGPKTNSSPPAPPQPLP